MAISFTIAMKAIAFSDDLLRPIPKAIERICTGVVTFLFSKEGMQLCSPFFSVLIKLSIGVETLERRLNLAKLLQQLLQTAPNPQSQQNKPACRSDLQAV